MCISSEYSVQPVIAALGWLPQARSQLIASSGSLALTMAAYYFIRRAALLDPNATV
jgi:hypothetical protein